MGPPIKGTEKRVCFPPLGLFLTNLIPSCIGGGGDNSPPSSGPGPLFFMYSKLAEEEDNKMAERWQQDADGLLIFVSSQVRFTPLHASTGNL
jgi:hypothetical protein